MLKRYLGGSTLLSLILTTSVHAENPVVDPMTYVPDPATVTMPNLNFTAKPDDEADYDKYFYFHRTETSFEQALADLRECDGFASGLSSGYQYQQAPYPNTYTMAGVAGAAIANVLIAGIFGSGRIREKRRVNMRRCMGYKGYLRYGLKKDLWVEFNFEEGFSKDKEPARQAMIAQQAKVASGPRPVAKELGL
jgi:hypothetical protein